MTASTGTCERCGRTFEVPADLQERYPGWTPSRCSECFRGSRAGGRRRGTGSAATAEGSVPLDEVLDRYTAGPDSGVFTDGSAQPNPGPGGWGAVYVVDGEIVEQAHGREDHTTNNRMELTAVINGGRLVPDGTPATIYTDSRLVVDTLTTWARGWEQRGWRRKSGPIQNLELVKEAYRLLRERPELDVAWVPGHAGYRWNEYADALATLHASS